MERTTVTVSKEQVDALKALTLASSKTQAVMMAIEEEIKRRKLASIRSLAGRLDLGTVRGGRHHDRRLG